MSYKIIETLNSDEDSITQIIQLEGTRVFRAVGTAKIYKYNKVVFTAIKSELESPDGMKADYVFEETSLTAFNEERHDDPDNNLGQVYCAPKFLTLQEALFAIGAV